MLAPPPGQHPSHWVSQPTFSTLTSPGIFIWPRPSVRVEGTWEVAAHSVFIGSHHHYSAYLHGSEVGRLPQLVPR